VRESSHQIKPLTEAEAAEVAKLQVLIYPREMQEDEQTVRSVLRSTDLSRGVYAGPKLIGYALVRAGDQHDFIYLYDIAILPQFQRKGLGKKVAQEVFRLARRRNLKITMHVRSTAYRLFGDPKKVRELGYAIVKDEYRPNWYFTEFGINEDAHELLLEPVRGRTQYEEKQA
jgi:ribosomal protein S18 acetylase RimI-like enzyme